MLTKICASKFRGLVLVSDSSTYKYDFSPEKTYFREKENSCFQAISNFSKVNHRVLSDFCERNKTNIFAYLLTILRK